MNVYKLALTLASEASFFGRQVRLPMPGSAPMPERITNNHIAHAGYYVETMFDENLK